MIHHSSGSAHNYLNAVAKLPHLTLYVLAAVDGCRTDSVNMTGKLADFIACLYGKLSGGTEDQHLHAIFSVGEQPFDGRDGKRRGFAGAGLGLSDYVSAAHEQRNGLRLYRSGFFVSQVVNRLHHRRGQPEFVKGYSMHNN